MHHLRLSLKSLATLKQLIANWSKSTTWQLWYPECLNYFTRLWERFILTLWKPWLPWPRDILSSSNNAPTISLRSFKPLWKTRTCKHQLLPWKLPSLTLLLLILPQMKSKNSFPGQLFFQRATSFKDNICWLMNFSDSSKKELRLEQYRTKLLLNSSDTLVLEPKHLLRHLQE